MQYLDCAHENARNVRVNDCDSWCARVFFVKRQEGGERKGVRERRDRERKSKRNREPSRWEDGNERRETDTEKQGR